MNNIMSTSFLIFFHNFFTKKENREPFPFLFFIISRLYGCRLSEVVSNPVEDFLVFFDEAVNVIVDELDVSLLGGKFM